MVLFKGLTALPALDTFLQPPFRLFFEHPIIFHLIIKFNSMSIPCGGEERSFTPPHLFPVSGYKHIPIIGVFLLSIAPEPPALNLKVLFKITLQSSVELD